MSNQKQWKSDRLLASVSHRDEGIKRHFGERKLNYVLSVAGEYSKLLPHLDCTLACLIAKKIKKIKNGLEMIYYTLNIIYIFPLTFSINLQPILLAVYSMCMQKQAANGNILKEPKTDHISGPEPIYYMLPNTADPSCSADICIHPPQRHPRVAKRACE